jgi:hypothetical protein
LIQLCCDKENALKQRSYIIFDSIVLWQRERTETTKSHSEDNKHKKHDQTRAARHTSSSQKCVSVKVL